MHPKQKRLSVTDMIAKLQERYKGKYCSLAIPGYPTVYGMVNEMSLETIREPTVIITLKDRRYTVSLEEITQTLKLLGNANTKEITEG